MNRPNFTAQQNQKKFFEMALAVISAHILFRMEKIWTGKWQNIFVKETVNGMKLEQIYNSLDIAQVTQSKKKLLSTNDKV